MDTLNISTGEKRIAINGDESRVIVFNPNDVIFAEKFYRLIAEFQKNFAMYQEEGRTLDADNAIDESGLPLNMSKRLELVRNACTYIRGEIDNLFGVGTSQIAFGDVMSLDAIKQFFEGMAPLIQTARVEKIEKYTNRKSKRAL